MRPTLALLPVLLAAPAGATDIGIADFEVTGAEDTALVVALDKAVDAATRAVGGCREAGGRLETCLCESRSEIAEARAALDAAIAANPEWEDKTLFIADTGSGQSLTIFLDTVARMAAPPSCP